MTHIRSTSEKLPLRLRLPRCAPKPEGFLGFGRKATVAGIIGLAMLTGVNLWAAIRVQSSAADMAAVQERLGQLSAFEERLTAKLDTVNNGVHGQFDRLNATLASRIEGTETQISRVESAVGAVRRTIDERQLAMPTPDATEVAAIEPMGKLPRVIRKSAKNSSAPEPQASAPPQLSSSYVRVESPDGKVTYRKVR